MSTCCPEFYPIKVSQLSRYQNIDLTDFLLVIESGSANYSRRSTIADLVNSFRLFSTGSYSGSFSGSYSGKVISKNTIASGSFSGSYFGRIISKNTKSSGSFSGSFYGSLLSKNTKATGSFRGTSVGIHYGTASGSLQGSLISKNAIASGSFSGSHYGKVISKNTIASGSFSGSIFGKILSKNIKATGSLSGSLYGKSTFSNTSSYLKQETNQSYKFTYFDGDGLVNSPYFSYIPAASIYDNYYISSSNPANYLIIDSKAGSSGFAESGLVLSNNYKRNTRVPSYNWGPEGWRLFTNRSGSLDLSSLTGSYQFTNVNFTSKGINPYFSALRTVNNVFYFWPEPNSYNTINRDGSVAIGVIAANNALTTQPTKARLHISVFSSSVANRGKGAWTGTGTVRQLDGAIYVEYGSGSIASPLQRTFFVSGSGNMYSAGTFRIDRGITGSISGSTFGRIVSKNTRASGSFSGSYFGRIISRNTKASGSFSGSYFGSLRSKNTLITGSFRGVDNITNFKGTGKKVSFNGTASYAVSSSYALTASYLSTGNSSAFVQRKIIDIHALANVTQTNTIPYLTPSPVMDVSLSWICKTAHEGWNVGDIVNFESVIYKGGGSNNDDMTPAAAVTINKTAHQIFVGWSNNNWINLPHKSLTILYGAARKDFEVNNWYLRITLLY